MLELEWNVTSIIALIIIIVIPPLVFYGHMKDAEYWEKWQERMKKEPTFLDKIRPFRYSKENQRKGES